MKALLFFLTLLTFKISASDDLTAALSEAVADAFAKEAVKEGVRIGTDLVTSMDFSSLDKDNGQCLATLAKKVSEISTNNPKATLAIVGLGTTDAFKNMVALMFGITYDFENIKSLQFPLLLIPTDKMKVEDLMGFLETQVVDAQRYAHNILFHCENAAKKIEFIRKYHRMFIPKNETLSFTYAPPPIK